MHSPLLWCAGLVGRAITLCGNLALVFVLVSALRWDGPVTRAFAFYAGGIVFAVAWNLSGALEQALDFVPGFDWMVFTLEYVWISQVVQIGVVINLLVAIRGWPWQKNAVHPSMPPGEAKGEKGETFT